MEFIDKETLSKLTQKYKDTTMASAVIDIVMATGEQDERTESGYPEMILTFIQKLEGVRIRLREIHWSTKSATEHEQTDQAMSLLMVHEDEIAESFMGLCDYRIQPGQIVPIFPDSADYRSLLKVFSEETLQLIKSLQQHSIFVGIISKLEDLYVALNKLMYLSKQE